VQSVTWIWSLVFTQPITGGADASGFAHVSPKAVARKRLNLLSSAIHQNFPTVFYFGRFVGILPNFTSSLLLR
jgi:hypothetical protein